VHPLLAGRFLLGLEVHEARPLSPQPLVQPHPLQLVLLELCPERREPLLDLLQPSRQPAHLGGGVGGFAARVRRGALGLPLQAAGLQLLLPCPLGCLAGHVERRFRCGELGQRPVERGGGAAARGFRLAHFVLERVELGVPLQWSSRGRAAVQEHGAVGAP